jgi:MFS family permease
MSGEPHHRSGETATVVTVPPPGAFTALRYRDYRLLLTGQFVATIGQQMQTVAITYQVYQLHHSALDLGLLGLFRLIPVLAFSLVGGVVADRVDRRRLLLVTQPALLLCSLALILATVAGWASIAVIFTITAVAATMGTMAAPARQAFLPALIPREHLANALSWNITLSEVATIAGPALGGLAIGAIGIAGTYAFEAASFVVVIITLLAMHIRLGPAAVDGPPGWRAALEGLRFVRGNSIIAAIMSLDFFATFWGSATVLLPVYADKVLHVGPTGLGILFSAPAVGSVLGAVAMTAMSHRIRRPGWPLLCAVAGYGFATVGVGFSHTMPIALLFLAGTGLADTVSMTFRHQILQLLTPDALRGRVSSAHQLFAGSGPQLGQLEAGVVAARYGAPFSIASGGLACILSVAIIAWLVPAIRRYQTDT